MDIMVAILFFCVPIIFSGTFHMWVVTKNMLPSMKIPIHDKWFGPNKTWRGIVVMILGTVLGVYLSLYLFHLWSFLIKSENVPTYIAQWKNTPIAVGTALGLGYVCFELPNSFLKRRLQIKAGELPKSGQFTKYFFVLLDQADSVIGCLLAYTLIWPLNIHFIMYTILVGTGLHLMINALLYVVGLRKRPC